MINEIGIYDNNGDLQSVEPIGALGGNVSINAEGINAANANAAFEEINGKINDVSADVSALGDNSRNGYGDVVVDGLSELYVGRLEPRSITQSGNAYTLGEGSDVLVSDPLFVPQKGLTYTAHIADGYVVALMSSSGSLTSYMADGESVTLSSSITIYRVVVKKSDDGNIGVSDADLLGLSLTFPNTAATWAIAAFPFTKYKQQTELVKQASGNWKLPLIGHISDTHTDNVRTKRMLDYCDEIGVMCACLTGDYANDGLETQGFWWVSDLINQAKCPVMICAGNHDSNLAKHYTQAYAPAAKKLGVYGSPNSYKDFPLAKLRIISIDQCKTGGPGSYTADDENWMCNAVLGTPAGFGLLIMYHIPEVSLYGSLPEGSDTTFYDEVSTPQSFAYNTNYNEMIVKIVDAFIGGATYTKAKSSGTFSFASKNTGAVFVAHVNGHYHLDNIINLQDAQWYSDNNKDAPSHRQILLNVAAGSVGKSTSAKNWTNYSQDLFNIYAIDLENKVINVVRIGADNGGTRKSMTISFDDNETES